MRWNAVYSMGISLLCISGMLWFWIVPSGPAEFLNCPVRSASDSNIFWQVNKMNKDNRIVKILTCIGECCLSCLERFMNFVNKNAYIQTAIEGTSFCTSAVAAFNILLRNFLRLGALTIVSSIFLQVYILNLIYSQLELCWVLQISNLPLIMLMMSSLESCL